MHKAIRKISTASAALILAVGFIHEAQAANAGPVRLVQANASTAEFNLPAQPLADSLRAVAGQTNSNILFDRNLVQGLSARPLKAQLSVAQALQTLLKGTGLTYRNSDDKTIMIVSERTDAQTSFSRGEAVAVNLAQADQAMQKVDTEHSKAAKESGETASDQNSNESSSDSTQKGIPEILVKGSRGNFSLNADIKRTEDDVQPYIVLDAKDIRRSGATDLQHFLNDRMTAGAAISTSQMSGSTFGNSTVFNLRGLGYEETLVLINGRRVVSQANFGSPMQADLGGIPLSAVERVEILPSTASGIFGGGATGGVINVVLKQSYQGMDLHASFDDTFKSTAPERKVELSGGFSPDNGKTGVMITGAYYESSQLYAGERSFLADARATTLRNNPDAFYGPGLLPPLGATANIRSLASTLTLKPEYGGAVLPSSITHVPVGYLGAASDNGAELIRSAGSYNLGLAPTGEASGGSRQTIFSATLVKSLSATVRHKFSERIQAFTEVATSENRGTGTLNANFATYTLEPTASTNPFQEAIQVTAPAYGLDGESRSKISTRRVVAGLSAVLGNSWNLVGEYSWSRNRFFQSNPSTVFPAPAFDAVSAGEIDLLRDASLFPIDFGDQAVAPIIYGPAMTTLMNPVIRLGGALPFDFLGGAPSLAIALEYRKEELGDAYNAPPEPEFAIYWPARHQSTKSVYMESRVPVVSARNRIFGIEDLEMQLAVRNDQYTTVAGNTILVTDSPAPVERRQHAFSSTDPTAGVRYTPFSGVTFRASYAGGFLPPNVSQLVPSADRVANISPQANLRDPRRGNEVVTGRVTILSGGNPDLSPERAKSWTIGAILTPQIVPNLRVSIDRTHIRKSDNIATLSQQNILINEAFLPQNVIRAPATALNDPNGYGVGPITTISTRRVNIASTEIEALDIAIDYDWSLGNGRGLFSARGTRMIHNVAQVSPLASKTEYAGFVSDLRWAASASLSWELGGWSAGWQSRYFDSYWLNLDHSIDPNQGRATISSQIYHDVFVAFDQAGTRSDVSKVGTFFSGVSIQAGVKNVLNEKPSIVASDLMGYSYFGDPRLARYYLSVKKSF